jgi:hypothetical protein
MYIYVTHKSINYKLCVPYKTFFYANKYKYTFAAISTDYSEKG